MRDFGTLRGDLGWATLAAHFRPIFGPKVDGSEGSLGLGMGSDFQAIRLGGWIRFTLRRL